uniref:Serine/threonine-protein phosphatase 6 regulatory ankyrin repeat subunit B n=1 Tax=Laticauda laticaudata TaxID=8630 RepID=A0A8C5RNH3_LATLA
MLAVAYGHIDAVSLLLEKEASVDAADILGCTALHRGIMTGHEECIQMLLEQEVLILCKDARGRTPLHYAAARGHATWLSELMQLALSEDYNFKDNQNYTPLHWASYHGNENCIEVLLEHKAFRNFNGNSFSPLHCAVTPLHAAAFADHVECLQLLLSHNAQVNAADNSGKTPLTIAAEKGHVGTVDFLVNSAKADLTLMDNDLNTSLHLASSKVCLKLYITFSRPLHIAAQNGLKMVVEELLAKGACVQAVDENGHTPALACAPNKDVADCLALILATMMPFSPSSTMTPLNFVSFKKDHLSRTLLCNSSNMSNTLNSYSKTLMNDEGAENGYNDNDSDSETF